MQLRSRPLSSINASLPPAAIVTAVLKLTSSSCPFVPVIVPTTVPLTSACRLILQRRRNLQIRHIVRVRQDRSSQTDPVSPPARSNPSSPAAISPYPDPAPPAASPIQSSKETSAHRAPSRRHSSPPPAPPYAHAEPPDAAAATPAPPPRPVPSRHKARNIEVPANKRPAHRPRLPPIHPNLRRVIDPPKVQPSTPPLIARRHQKTSPVPITRLIQALRNRPHVLAIKRLRINLVVHQRSQHRPRHRSPIPPHRPEARARNRSPRLRDLRHILHLPPRDRLRRPLRHSCSRTNKSQQRNHDYRNSHGRSQQRTSPKPFSLTSIAPKTPPPSPRPPHPHLNPHPTPTPEVRT